MNDMDSLRSLYKPNVDVIRAYLLRELPPGEISETEDFDRDGLVFKRFERNGTPFRFFVSHEFLSDFDVRTVNAKLEEWRIADKLSVLPSGHTLFLTTEGTFAEKTDGPSLRQWADDLGGSFGFSKERSVLMDRVLSIPFNGTPLGDMPTEMQGNPEYFISYSQGFADALIAAYLLDAAGYHDYELSQARPGEGVDLHVRLDSGRLIYLELKSAQNPSDRRANALREQVNVGLRKAIREDPLVRQALNGYFVQITMHQAPTTETDVKALITDILRFIQTTPLEDAKRGSYVAFDASAFSYLASYASRVYVTEGPTHLSVQEGATTFDPNEPYIRASQIIQEASREIFVVHPVWLVVSLANTPAEFVGPDDTVKHLAEISVNATPFEKIIVGYPGNATVYGRTP